MATSKRGPASVPAQPKGKMPPGPHLEETATVSVTVADNGEASIIVRVDVDGVDSLVQECRRHNALLAKAGYVLRDAVSIALGGDPAEIAAASAPVMPGRQMGRA